jgi:hypothetical protein
MSSSNDVDSGDAGCAFYGGCPTDLGGSPNECSPWVQDCPEGEKCMPFDSDGNNSWDALKCVPVARDPGKPGEPCTAEGSGVSGIDDCELGAMCWSVDNDTKEGVCVAMCTGSPDDPTCTVPDTSCLIANDEVLILCLPGCDPLLNECAPDEVCVPSPQDKGVFICALDASGDGGKEFDECAQLNSCDPGLLCGDSAMAAECDQNALRCCVAFCDLTMPACNGAGAECVPWFEEGMAPEGLDHLGVCRIPE